MPKSRAAVRRVARNANVKDAERHVAEVLPLAQCKRAAGKTLQEIADYLTGRGLRTCCGVP